MVCALIIDTDMGLIALAASVLNRGGYSVRSVDDTRGALRMLRCWQPDAIIVGDRMPIMSGGDFCRAVKHEGALSHIPLVIVSDGDAHHDLIYFQQTGADAVIVKPYRPADLLGLVNALLQDGAVVAL